MANLGGLTNIGYIIFCEGPNDNINRLVKKCEISSQSFDADGNRDSLSYPNENQTQFAFDLNGRLIQETLATGDKVKYTYSARDLLESVTNGSNQQRQFEYDSAGRIIRWTDPDGSVSYMMVTEIS